MRSVARGNRREEQVARREKDRSPMDPSTSGTDTLETMPRMPKRAGVFRFRPPRECVNGAKRDVRVLCGRVLL